VVSASENDSDPNNQLDVVLEVVGEDVVSGVSMVGEVIVEDDFSDENSGWRGAIRSRQAGIRSINRGRFANP